MLRRIAILLLFSALASDALRSQDTLTLTTWNIEHLGTKGRGFGGGFGGSGASAIPPGPRELPRRSDEQLNAIADLIDGKLGSDILALQEIAISGQRLGRSRSKHLDAIVSRLEESGGDWGYFLPVVEELPNDREHRENQHLAFLWNRQTVRLLAVFEMNLANHTLAGKELFERKPIVGYFEPRRLDDKEANDFVVVNVHFASGQDLDENHLIAMTLLEHELSNQLAQHNVSDSDRIILGDLNDNPSMRDSRGGPKYSPALYEHMKHKGYVDLVDQHLGTSRMNADLDSLIDHVLVNSSIRSDVPQSEADIYRPDAGKRPIDVLPAWRLTYSDHFPISVRVIIRATDDDDDFFK